MHTPTRSSNAHSTFCDTTHNAKFPQISTQIINKIRWNTFRILLFSFFNCAPKFSFYEVVKWSQQYVAIGLTTVRIVAHWNHTVSRGERAERNRGTIICCVQQPPEKRAYKKKKNKKLYFPIAHFGILSSRRSVRKSLWMAQHIHTYMHAESASKACHVSAHTHACSAPTLTHSLTHSPIHSPIHSYTLHMHANRTRMWVCTVDTNRHGESLTCATHPFALCIHERCGLWAYRVHQ